MDEQIAHANEERLNESFANPPEYQEEAPSSSNELSRNERYHRRSIMSTQISDSAKKKLRHHVLIQLSLAKRNL